MAKIAVMQNGSSEKVRLITHRPTVMDVDLDAISYNFRKLVEFSAPSKVMPIVKANAYGHGLVPCARHLQEIGAECLGVAFVEEGIELRQAGITVPILVLGGILGRQIKHFLDYDLEITASSVDKLELINEIAASLKKRAQVHLKIDTGMERVGTHYYSADKLYEASLKCKSVNIVGVYSHFAAVKKGDIEFTKLQLERFLESYSFFEKHSLSLPTRHIASTGAALWVKESHLDMVRLGIGIYGVCPTLGGHDVVDLKPAMTVRSSVVYFKVVRKGAGVSYSLTWHAPEDTRVVTVPIGYGDGYPRVLSNKAKVLIRGNRYPVVGLVCMDQLMVNIGPKGESYNEDEVVLVGAQGNERITIEELADVAGMTAHELLVCINLRVPRRYFKGGELVAH